MGRQVMAIAVIVALSLGALTGEAEPGAPLPQLNGRVVASPRASCADLR